LNNHSPHYVAIADCHPNLNLNLKPLWDIFIAKSPTLVSIGSNPTILIATIWRIMEPIFGVIIPTP
jgi:hypothetical protein